MKLEEDGVFGVNYLNKWRQDFHDFNYKKSEEGNYPNPPALQAFTSWLGHRSLTVVTIPANLIAASLSCVGMIGSSLLAIVKIAYSKLKGKPCNWPTGAPTFYRAAKGSFYQVGKNVGEILYEWKYRLTHIFSKVIHPKGSRYDIPLRALPGFHHINNKRHDMRQRLASSTTPIRSKLKIAAFSVLNIATNGVGMVISLAGLTVSSALIVAKVALYVILGVKITLPVGFKYFGMTFAGSAWNIIRNVGEEVKDIITIPRNLSDMCGLTRILTKARDKVSPPFKTFWKALVPPKKMVMQLEGSSTAETVGEN